jgi:predicted transcriptional regulator
MQYRLKRQMSLNLPQAVMDALIAEAEKQDRSRSYIAERAIRAYLKLDQPATAQTAPAQPPPTFLGA